MGLWDNQEEWEEPLGKIQADQEGFKAVFRHAWACSQLAAELAGGLKWVRRETHTFQVAQISIMDAWQQLHLSCLYTVGGA